MNILYLIGNGFDLAQGLKTKYTDFYPYYIGRTVYNPAVRKMLEDIGKDFYTWADLELRLGQYSAEIEKDDFDDVYYDLSDCLQEYLKKETSTHVFSDEDIKKIGSDLIDPVKYLTGRDQAVIDSMLDSDSNHHISVISFNYTDVLDKALPMKGIIGARRRSNVFFDDIFHVHGTLGSTIILGVNDSSQIANGEFVRDEDVKDLLVKPQANDAIRSIDVLYCQRLIELADIIFLYGLSIGETDRLWWQLIGKRMLVNDTARVVIFKYEDIQIDPTKGQKLGSKRRKVINDFMDKMGLPDESNIRERIYVSFDQSFMTLK